MAEQAEEEVKEELKEEVKVEGEAKGDEQKDDDEMSIIEPDEEPPDTSNIYSSDKVFIGSGVEAGAWAAALAARGASDGALIVTDQPRGTAPYDRSSLTNTLIDPTMEAARSFNNIPFCTLQPSISELLQVDSSIAKGNGEQDESKVQNLAWYAANGIQILSGLTLVEADLEKKTLIFTELKTSTQQEESKFHSEQVLITVHFGQLCVGTGLTPLCVPGPGPKFGWTVDCTMSPLVTESINGNIYTESDTGSVVSMDERSFTESEVSESKLNDADSYAGSVSFGKLEVSAPEEYGFGSVHYLSDIGDGTKLIYALSRAEEDGQEPVFDPVVVIGGGPMALETCSSLSNHFPDLSLLLVLPRRGVLPSIFGSNSQEPLETDTKSNGNEAPPSARANNAPQTAASEGPAPCEELAAFYESQLVKRGIKIARGFTVSRLWLPHEEGNFSTLDGPPSSLRPTRPRPFSAAQSQFKQSRGVVLAPTPTLSCDSPTGYNAEEVYVPARLVIVCGEQSPNVPAPLVAAGLKTLPQVDEFNEEFAADSNVVVVPNVASSASTSKALMVDTTCRTSHPNVFACGGCAAFTIHPAIKNKPTSRPTSRASTSRPGSRPGTSQSKRQGKSKPVEAMLMSHLTSPENSAEMAKFVATMMIDGIPLAPSMLSRRASNPSIAMTDDAADAFTSYPYNTPGKFSPVPFLTCRMSELSFRFAGSTSEATPVLVGSTIGYPKFFSCIWVKDNRIVGVFLEGGEAKHSSALLTMASQRPRIINIKKLKRVNLETLLNDPFCLEPPVLEFKGEFLAELDDDAVFDALRVFDVDGGGVVKTSSLGAIMTELGSDWDDDELAEAEAAMDPSGRGLVSYETFRTWWGN